MHPRLIYDSFDFAETPKRKFMGEEGEEQTKATTPPPAVTIINIKIDQN